MDELTLPLTVGRGALVGFLVGLVIARIWADGLDRELDGLFNFYGMILAPFVLSSLLLAFVVHLPVWWAVAVGGSLAALVLGFALQRIAPNPHYYGFNMRYFGTVFVVASVIGYVVVALFVSGVGGWWSRVMIVGLMVAVVIGAARFQDPVQRWHRARGFGLLGVPLVAPQIPGHTLVKAAIWRLRDQGPAIRLTYRRGRRWTADPSYSEVDVWIRPGTIATPAAACAEPYARHTWGTKGVCQQITGGHWVRWAPLGTATQLGVFTQHGEALIQIETLKVPLTDLLNACQTIRPVSATFLANHAPPAVVN